MIRFSNVSLWYDDTQVFSQLSFDLAEGELIVLAGPTGSGKSSLLHIINGLVPEFSGGRLSGHVFLDDVDRQYIDRVQRVSLIGSVQQSPLDGFVTDNVEDEIAFGLETIGMSNDAMRQRVEEVIDLLSLHDIRNRTLGTLSGGQQQRVAIATALALQPRILLMDEPTSALDPTAADEVFSTIHRLVHDLGITVVVAEHRLERVMHFADRVVLLTPDQKVVVDTPERIVRRLPAKPILTQLADMAGSKKSPLTVREARKLVAPLKLALADLLPTSPDRYHEDSNAVVKVEEVSVVRDGAAVLKHINFSATRGEITAIMGRNGAGKSTFLHTLIGDHPYSTGSIALSGRNPRELTGSELLATVSIVPQQPQDLLLSDRVSKECQTSDSLHQVPAGTTLSMLNSLSPQIDPLQHPRDLSEGQRLSLALAVTLAGKPDVLLLDEPTRGLDNATKQLLIEGLRKAANNGQTIILATHDVELAAELAHNVVILGDGEIVAQGPARDVLTASTMFAPMTSKVLAPQKWLTVNEIKTSQAKASSN
jgi:energy-coupling factor transport system ATP-binding protein